MQASRIIADETYKEVQAHGTPDYPIGFYYEDIYLFDFHCIEWHWHPELELIYVEEGCFEAQVGNERFTMKTGEALLINQNVIHRLEAQNHAVIPNAVFLPRLIAAEDSLIYRKYILPVLDSSVDYMHIRGEDLWEEDCLRMIRLFFECPAEKEELSTVASLMEIWKTLYEHLPVREMSKATESTSLVQTRLRIMMSYIHQQYKNELSLESIANTVSLSKSSVLVIFKAYLHMSPVQYLIQYRLNKAAELLRTTQTGIEAIAYDTGFQNIGYFCRKFKEVYSVTPSEYRRQ